MQNKLASFSVQDRGTNAEMPSVGTLGSIRKKVTGTRFMPTAMETLRTPMTAQRFEASTPAEGSDSSSELLRVCSPSTDKAKAGSDLCEQGSDFRAGHQLSGRISPAQAWGRTYVPRRLKCCCGHISKESSRGE